MFDVNGITGQLASDAYLALDRLVKSVENTEDVPHDIITEGEELIESFQGYLDTLKEA